MKTVKVIKTSILSLFCIASIVVCLSNSFAQRGTLPRSTTKPGSGRLIPEKRIGTATASYFRSGNHVTVQLRPLQLTGNPAHSLVLLPNFIVAGKKVVEPEWVNLELIVASSEGTHLQNRQVQIYVGEKVAFSGTPKLILAKKEANSSMTEILMQRILYSKFLQMTGEREVKIKLGGSEFKLSEEHLKTMRDLQRIIDARFSFP